MLLSAVSVLVVAQSSSEIPEGLMNNPVFRQQKFLIYLTVRPGVGIARSVGDCVSGSTTEISWLDSPTGVRDFSQTGCGAYQTFHLVDTVPGREAAFSLCGVELKNVWT